MGLLDLLFSSPELFIIYFLALIYGITVHEFSHAYVAYLAGDDDQIINKRLTLNPLRHIDPLGIITLILFGIGWGKSVYVNINKFDSKKLKFYVYLLALSGILANILSALFFALILKLLLIFNLVVLDNNLLVTFLITLININVVLAVFNLLPIAPLDGSKILNVFLPSRFDRLKFFLMTHGNNILFAILLFSVIFNISIFSYLYDPVINFIYTIFRL